MSTSASVRKIKIPSLNASALPRKKKLIEPTAISVSADDVLIDVAKMLVRKYKILPKWDQSRTALFEALKTRSESKCMVELYRMCKKSLRKKSSSEIIKPKENTIFREIKKKKTKHSSKKKSKSIPSGPRKKAEDVQENTITESAQRSA